MVFKRKKPEEETKEIEEVKTVEEVVSPEAEEIKSEEPKPEAVINEVEPETVEDLDSQLNSVLVGFETRIQALEATIYRLRNI